MIYKLLVSVLCGIGGASALVSSLNDLPFNVDNRLEHNMLLHTSKCSETSSFDERVVTEMSDAFASEFKFIDTNSTDLSSCFAVCLNKGSPKPEFFHVFPEDRYSSDKSSSALSQWVQDRCQRKEVGFISYHKPRVHIMWEGQDGNLVKLQDLDYGERKVVWQQTFLGHIFHLKSSENGETLLVYKVTHDGFVPIGDPGTLVGATVPVESIKNTFHGELARSQKVKRTFTPLGFDKGRLPTDIWNSIQTYHYNNKDTSFTREEWENKGYFVNWWEAEAYMIGMPWQLKGYWQSRLRGMVEQWIGGVPLEDTSIYGIRRYTKGARLLTHVDREETHAASMIVNVAQGDVQEPWLVEIYDFMGRLHEIEMQPGDIVYYESARCLHGRMKALNGGFYDNLFTHYRPVGDNLWYTRPNPPETPEQLLDIDNCVVKDGVRVCERENDVVSMPYLSPSGETVTRADDLFEYWKKISPKEKAHAEL